MLLNLFTITVLKVIKQIIPVRVVVQWIQQGLIILLIWTNRKSYSKHQKFSHIRSGTVTKFGATGSIDSSTNSTEDNLHILIDEKV